MNKINGVRSEDFFRICKPCVFSSECCVCKTCSTLVRSRFLEAVEKIRNDFEALKEVSLEILAGQGCECNYGEVLSAIKNDQSNKAVKLLSEVVLVANDLLEISDQQRLNHAEVAKAKELVGRINQFLKEATASCEKTFGNFQESDFIKEAPVVSF